MLHFEIAAACNNNQSCHTMNVSIISSSTREHDASSELQDSASLHNVGIRCVCVCVQKVSRLCQDPTYNLLESVMLMY